MASKKGSSYYCKYCKVRHKLSSKIGMQHWWNKPFTEKHPNNCIRWERE